MTDAELRAVAEGALERLTAHVKSREAGARTDAARLALSFGGKASDFYAASSGAATVAGVLLTDLRALLDTKAALREALEVAQQHAKQMREAYKVQGPREYQDRPREMKVWMKTRYRAGKDLADALRAALDKPALPLDGQR